MNYLQNWREYIPDKERLYPLLALVAIIVIGLGYFLFINSSILPQLRARREIASQLASAEIELRKAEKAQEGAPDRLKEQVATAQATLNEAASVFLSESQAAEVLNKLYQYASESGVEVTDMQAQPSPEEKKSVYDVRAFRLQVEGALPKLTDFVSRIKEAALKSFVITNVNITEGEELHTLTMDIALYTSPYSSGGVVQTPGVTPATTSANLTQLNEELAIALASREWERIISLINQILAIDPYYDNMAEKLYTAHVNYGYQLLEEGDTGGAATQFNLALEIKPDGEEALAGLQQATTTPSPTLTVEEQLKQRLDEAWAAENWEEAISLIEQILAIRPDYDDMIEKLYAAHVNYGHKLVAEGKLEEAKEEFIRALDIKPDGEEAMAGLRDLAGETPGPSPTSTAPLPLPSATPTSPSQPTIYVVRQGDTLYSIARRYGTTVQAIMAANGLTNYNIYVGQQLHIPTP
jgi:LysM repeat protein/Tfp pilus assembly protein PilO